MTGKYYRIASAALLVTLFLAVAVTAGCGGKTPSEILDAGLEKSSAAVSLEADILIETEPESGSRSIPLTLEGSAAVDTVARAVSMSVEAMGIEAELRYVDGDSYVELGGEWYSLGGGADDFLSALVEGVSEAVFSYPRLLEQYTGVADLGLEKVSGKECHHLSVSLDLQGLADQPAVQKIGVLLDVEPPDLLAELENLAPDVEVWVDRHDYYIRKLTISARADAGDGLGGFDLIKGRMGVTGTAVFSGYDLPLEIEAPTDISPFDPSTLPFF